MTKAKTTYYNNIIVPLDGSHNAKLAFQRALVMAEHHPKTTKLHLVHAISEAADLTTADDAFVHTVTKIDTKKIKKYQAVAKKHHVKADYLIACGPPKVLIAHNFVDHFHANLIVMGSNGLTPIERVLMGSVAVYVAREAPCDVLLFKDPLNHI